MAYVPYTGTELPNLFNVAKRMDPDGMIADIAELLSKQETILEDIPMVQGNLPTGHRTTVRTGLPTPTWRRLNYGVMPTKSTTAQVDDSCGMLEDYGEVDKELVKLNGNDQAFRLSEDTPHLESMAQEMASTIFYGDTAVNADRFLGLTPRYDVLGTPANKPTAITNSSYLKHVISAGGDTANEQTSVWFVQWGEQTVHGIYPKGSDVGLIAEDLGEVTLTDNNGGRFQGYRTHYQWKMGLVVRDWRNIVRICNVDLNDMDDATAQKALYHAMIKAKHTVPQVAGARGVFYASPGVHAMLDLAAVEKANAALGYREIFGREILMFRGSPIIKSQAILETEAIVS